MVAVGDGDFLIGCWVWVEAKLEFGKEGGNELIKLSLIGIAGYFFKCFK